jgi:hypothetical protein
MDTLRVILVEVPEHGIIWHIGLRMSLVASIHRRKLNGVPDKEDRKIIEDKILNTLLRVELGCPTSDITNCVGRSFFSTDSRDTGQDFGLLSNASEEVRVSYVRNVFKHLKFAKGAGCLCMHAPVMRR